MQIRFIRAKNDNIITIPEIILYAQFRYHVVIQQTKVKVTEQLAGVIANRQTGTLTSDNTDKGLHQCFVFDFTAKQFYQDILIDGVVELLQVKF